MQKDVNGCLHKVHCKTSLCFDKSRRLTEKKEYSDVFNQANRTSSQDFIFLHKKNAKTTARLGLVISKKAVPKAFQRNRIKRLLRESFRISQLPSVDIVVLAKRGVSAGENQQILSKLSILWQKIALFYAG